MSWTRLATAALLSAAFAAAATQLPAEEVAEPVRVRPGHARTAPTPSASERQTKPQTESQAPVRLTADVSPADTIEVTAEPVIEEPAVVRPIGSGVASYYGNELAGNPTASGERFDPSDLTAAHRTLPFGTMLEVTNPRTGESVVVRVNDRGPFHRARMLDLSKEAARRIGLVRAGTGRVDIAVIED